MMHANRPAQRGQSLVEFAIALPILILVILLIVDFGRIIYYYSAVHNAAREGARYGIIHPSDPDGMEDAARNYAVGLGMTETTVVAGLGAPQFIGAGNDMNYTVEVQVTYDFQLATPFLERIIFGPGYTASLTGDAVMRTETKP